MNLYIPSILLILAFALLTMGPSPVAQKTFLPIHKTLTIKTNKSLPPYIAYEATQEKNPFEKNEWDLLDDTPSVPLAYNSQKGQDPRPFSQKIVLHEVVIQKQIQNINPVQFEPAYSSVENPSVPIVREETSWKDSLTPDQKARLEYAENKYQANVSTVIQESKRSVASTYTPKNKSAASLVQSITKPNPEPLNNFKEEGFAERSADSFLVANGPKFDTKSLLQEIQVVGYIEIHKGLAVTNEHHIELRRKEEGVLQERGEIDIQKGTYNIRIPELTGSLVAQLVTKKGQVIGEGTVRVSQSVGKNEKVFQGPTVRVFPKSEMSGAVASAYRTESADPAPAETKVMFLNGGAEIEVKKDGKIQYDSLVRGSSTLLRAEAPGFAPTQQIVLAGNDFQSVLFPEKMITSFKNIVSEQRQSNYNDPKVPVIWGQVLQDGKAVAGLQVSLEGFDNIDVIYFNEFNLPDTNLKATSSQGGFAILDPPLGFQSVLVTRGESYYAHQNTIVDEGIVSFVRVESSLKTENTSVKVYDAFTGQSEMADLNIQGQPEKVFVNGYHNILLPQISQMSLLEAAPRPGYLSATYFYNEAQGYIHVPLISEAWMNWVTSQIKMNQNPGQSLIIGFVPDEDFEVVLLNSEKTENQNIIYFDSQGQILKSKMGVSGGGFILFNAPTEGLEAAVQLAKSQKTMSRLVPTKPGQVAVLNYRLE